MKTPAHTARLRLAEAGGNAFQDLGLGRIVGQILMYLYLTDGPCSLDDIGHELRLSKAAVSVAVRQLEGLGLVRRVWMPGDRKKYYRTADNIATALQDGLLAFIRQRLQAVGHELDAARALLDSAPASPDVTFLKKRLDRAHALRRRAGKVLQSPLLKLFVRG